MPWRDATLIFLCAALGGCSYDYEILAVARGGQLVFVVDPESGQAPSCVRQVEVIAEQGARARPQPGDNASRLGYGTFWFESVGYDDACANRFPVAYGTTLNGRHQNDRGLVAPKALLRDVVYRVSTTTGATGYGSGRFVIRSDGRIENLR